MNTFKRTIQKAFGEANPPRSIQNEIGETISDIRDVTAGIKLFAVFKSGKNGDSLTQSGSIVSDAESVSSMQSQPVTMYNEISIDDSASNAGSNISDVKYQSGAKNLFGVSPEKAIRLNSPKKENEDCNQSMLSESTSYSDDGADQHPLPENEDPDYDEEVGAEEEEEVAYDEKNVKSSSDLITSCIPVEENVVAEAYSQLIPESKLMLDEIFVLEDEQKVRFFNEMMKILDEQGFNPNIANLSNADLLISKAKCYLSQHRITNPINSSYMFHSAIVGPPKSGKSTFLGILTQQILYDMIITNSWKKTFLFVADLDKLMSGYQDIQSFYHLFVHHIFTLLMAQLPSMIQYLPKVEQAFLSITSMSSRMESLPLPRKLTQSLEHRKLSAELQSIGSSLAAIWFDPSSLNQWITSLVMLPSILARAFGFHDCIFVLDHFESCSVSMEPLYPFEDSQPIMFVHEFWKYAIQSYPFILSTGDENALTDSLTIVDETSIDLLSDIEFISLLDLVEEFPYDDMELNIDFEDENQVSLKLVGSSCGGIPIFTKQWEKINKSIDRIEGIEEGTEEYEEALCEMISETETLLFLLIQREQGDPNDSIEDQRFGVYNVHRRCLSK
ncbi:hypothetical protein TRFO_12161 [Tritrichomonas foetus]|uniref:Uncharacterized protein n=1 Tax=Tritrichomonas foetus TaxID=1144522 RepID=A0A1J4J705_9EUKA|nr:hypothetical protein TRFO_12161 [Tritrichomonas foetus]|eukprot:OHS92972.1 hypothetical protein TRFO_12161 [Tritrichomonas foetus]